MNKYSFSLGSRNPDSCEEIFDNIMYKIFECRNNCIKLDKDKRLLEIETDYCFKKCLYENIFNAEILKKFLSKCKSYNP